MIKNCINFFEKFFHTPFPFQKCDFAFVPFHCAAAMENPGIITYDDNVALLKNMTFLDLERRRVVMAHEISHMWFGDLVTMKWWNNLWLNESFADVMAYFCCVDLHKTMPYENCEKFNVWESYAQRKIWGYSECISVSTCHPIVVDVLDTGKADSVFDGISYSQGGASLI